MCSITKVDEDSFRVTNVEITIRFRRESSPHLSTSCLQVCLAKVRMNLGVPSGLMKFSEEPLFEDGSSRGGSRRR